MRWEQGLTWWRMSSTGEELITPPCQSTKTRAILESEFYNLRSSLSNASSPDQFLASLICGGEWRVFINSLHCQLNVSLSLTKFGLVTAVEYCNLVTFPFPITLCYAWWVSACNLVLSGAVPPSLPSLIINNLQINRTAYITSLAAPWSIPGMSLKLRLTNPNSTAVVWARSLTTHDPNAAFPHSRQGLNQNWKIWS